MQQSNLMIDVGIHPLPEEIGKLTDVSSTFMTKLQQSPLIVSLKEQRKVICSC